MLVGADDTYLEVELSPRGRYLVLFLEGERRVVHRGVRLLYRAEIEGRRWRGEASIPIGWIPIGLDRLNAFAIHGTGQMRRHLAWRPTGGPRPDFTASRRTVHSVSARQRRWTGLADAIR